MDYLILETLKSRGYELIDSGNNEKLERFGEVTVRRPDPQALWDRKLPELEWKKADAFFVREAESTWHFKGKPLGNWTAEIGGLTFNLRPSTFKHVGVFPEQSPNWRWIEDVIKKSGKKANVLNLFGYTGGATLAAAKAGAEVVHLDGSKVAIGWAKENAISSNLSGAPIRWILDDALSFVKREIKRGHRYDGIIMDPPAFGHGPAGELWKIEKNLPELFNLSKEILSDDPLFYIVNGYASGYSAIAYKNNLDSLFSSVKGTVEMGELTIKDQSGRLLSAGIFARYSKKF